MPQFISGIDHLVVTAPSLESGVAFVEAELGCRMQPGGQHPRMGTHNRLLRLGSDVYLEVLAIDPAAVCPDRPRWFGLDELSVECRPRLSAWVMRTNRIHDLVTHCPDSPGTVELMKRGELEWWITIPADGRGIMNGVLPPLIEWRTDPMPAARLPASGVELLELKLRHPDARRLQNWFATAGFTGNLRISEPLAEEPAGIGAVLQRSDGRIVCWGC